MSSLRDIGSIMGLGAGDLRALEALTVRERTLPVGSELRGDSRAPDCAIVRAGLVGRYRLLPQGRRQILSLHFAGDICDLHRPVSDDDDSLVALSGAKVALIPLSDLRELAKAHPQIAMSLWRRAAVAERISREWLVSLGRRSAYGRVAHLLCEVFTRYSAIGDVDADSCHLPLTQTELADALGLSVVHVNRVLQKLRAAGLVDHRDRRLHVYDLQRLRDVAEFDDGYFDVLTNSSAHSPRADGGGFSPSSTIGVYAI